MGMINKLKKQKKVPVAEADKPEVTKPEVVSKLEAEANVEAKQNFRFTTTQVQLITYMIDKHGMDFSAMSRDPKNHCKERGLITPSEKTNEAKEDEESDEEDQSEMVED